MKPIGLYVHIPFCRRKCYYCDFVSYCDCEDTIDTYIDAIFAEARLYESLFKDHDADTVFIGGGTPSLLSPAQVQRLLIGLKDTCNINAIEFTIEANPETLDEEKLFCYANNGVNRLSLGIQTHDNVILAAIGRRHTWETFVSAFETAQKHFRNISADTIFALPGQTIQNYTETLCRLIDMRLPHISCYALKLEEGTRLAAEFNGADEEIDREMYHAAAEMLTGAGYRHYETSNFALPGYECRHNIKYWTGGEYLGLGVAAHSYLYGQKKTRHANTESIDDYLNLIKEGLKPAVQTDELADKDERMEYLMLRLRLTDGINALDYNARFGGDFFIKHKAAIDTARDSGLIRVDSAGIRPTLKGYDLQNTLIGEFISE